MAKSLIRVHLLANVWKPLTKKKVERSLNFMERAVKAKSHSLFGTTNRCMYTLIKPESRNLATGISSEEYFGSGLMELRWSCWQAAG